MHRCIFCGVILSLAVTNPLTFSWIHFTLVEPDRYKAWFFGFPIVTFPIEAGSGFALPGACPRYGNAFPSAQFVSDLKGLLTDAVYSSRLDCRLARRSPDAIPIVR